MICTPSSLKNVLTLYSPVKYVSVGNAANGMSSATMRFSTFSCASTAAPSDESAIVPATLPPVYVTPLAATASLPPMLCGSELVSMM